MMYIKTKELNNIAVTVTFFILAIVILVYKPKSPEEREQKRVLNSKKLKNYNRLKLDHLGGLPIALNTLCEVRWFPGECFEIVGGGYSIKLDMEKIIDLQMQSKTDVVGGSVGGAILGNELFGTPGAIIGGSNRKVTSYYLVFTYLKDGKNAYIVMGGPDIACGAIRRYVKEFNKMKPQEIRRINY